MDLDGVGVGWMRWRFGDVGFFWVLVMVMLEVCVCGKDCMAALAFLAMNRGLFALWVWMDSIGFDVRAPWVLVYMW